MLKCSKFSRSMVNEKFVKKNWFVMNKIIWFLINKYSLLFKKYFPYIKFLSKVLNFYFKIYFLILLKISEIFYLLF